MARRKFRGFCREVTSGIWEALPKNAGFAVGTATTGIGTDAENVVLSISRGEDAEHLFSLDEYFREYQKGTGLGKILQEIVEVSMGPMPLNGRGSLIEYEDKVFVKLVNAAENWGLLARCPYIMVEDLAAVCCLDLGYLPDGSRAVAPITRALARKWWTCIKDLYHIAIENIREEGSVFLPVEDAMAELGHLEEGCGDGPSPSLLPPGMLYVLTTKDRFYGASVVLDEETMKEAARKLGDGFFAIPYSVHEFLAIPASAGISVEELNKKVQEVNMMLLRPEERLSDHAYQYHPGTGIKSVL